VSERVLVEDRNDTRWIRLNAPERRNAYDQAMADSISDALEPSSSPGSTAASAPAAPSRR
jgi:enoyl-CoA hydratase/carnithine racemase